VAVSEARKLRSLELRESWCTSTAMTLLPTCTTDGGRAKDRTVVSSEPERFDDARVVGVMGPAGMLSRTTSVPLT
jgi:hypothetical protein